MRILTIRARASGVPSGATAAASTHWTLRPVRTASAVTVIGCTGIGRSSSTVNRADCIRTGDAADPRGLARPGQEGGDRAAVQGKL